MGEIKGLEYYRQLYSVDAVHYADEILPVLEGLKAPALHVLHGQNTDRCHPWRPVSQVLLLIFLSVGDARQARPKLST